MNQFRSKIIYILFPLVLIIGAIFLVGTTGSPGDSAQLRGLTFGATTVTLDPPDDLNFAGEIVPLHDFDVQERLDKELIRYIYYHSATIMNIKRASRWRTEMTRILRKNQVPEDFFYLCIAESHLANVTSPVGAKGFWQFMPATGTSYGLEISKQVDERYDPIKSTHSACRYLKDSYKQFGNWTLVAASYNMGMGGVQKQLNRQKVSNYYDLYLNAETAAYVFRILAIKTVLENPSAYGFNLSNEQLYAPMRYKAITVDQSIPDLVAWALENGTTYKMLKVMNPWLLDDKLTVSSGKTYTLKVPKGDKLPAAASDLIPKSNETDGENTAPATDSLSSGGAAIQLSDSTQVIADSLSNPKTKK